MNGYRLWVVSTPEMTLPVLPPSPAKLKLRQGWGGDERGEVLQTLSAGDFNPSSVFLALLLPGLSSGKHTFYKLRQDSSFFLCHEQKRKDDSTQLGH